MNNLQFTYNFMFIKTSSIESTIMELQTMCYYYDYHANSHIKDTPLCDDSYVNIYNDLCDLVSRFKRIMPISETTAPEIINGSVSNLDSSSDLISESDSSSEVLEKSNCDDENYAILKVWKSVLEEVDDNAIIKLMSIISVADWINGGLNKYNYKENAEFQDLVANNFLLKKLLHPITDKDSISILSSIRGISKDTATKVIKQTSLLMLLSSDNKCCLGKVRKEKVINLLKHKIQ